MTLSTDPLQDPGRLAVIQELLDLVEPKEEVFDRLSRVAANSLSAPATFISIVAEDREVLPGCCGLPEPWASSREIPLSYSFCQHVIRSGEPLVVEDARSHPLSPGPEALENLDIAAYAGVPLRDSRGHLLGTVCAVDREPRAWSESDMAALRDLADATTPAIELWLSNAQRRLIIDASLEGVVAVSSDRRVIFYNSNLVRGCGIPESLLALDTDEEALRWIESLLVEPAEFRARIEAAYAQPEAEVEITLELKDGRVLSCFSAPLRGPSGRPEGRIWRFEDFTRQTRDREALHDSEERFRQIAENIREIFWMFDPDFTRTIYISPAYEEVWGRSLESLYQNPRSLLDAIHPADVGAVRTALQAAAHGAEGRAEYRVIQPDGTICWAWTRGFPVFDEEGRVYRVVGTTEDITARKAAEARYRRLVDNAPYPIYALDREGRFMELNQAIEEVIGRTPAELIGRPFTDIVVPEDLPKAEESLRRKLSGERRSTDLEIRLRHASGEPRLVHIRATVIREGDEITGTHGIARDITEERARQEQMRLLLVALEGLDEGVSITRPDGQIIYANSTHARQMGYDREGGKLPNTRSFLTPEGVEKFEEILRIVAEQNTWTGRVHLRRINTGEPLPMQIFVDRVEGANGESLVFAISRDITEELERERHLRRAERLASIGTLIGGVAHELNNPLHAIRNFAELMLMDERDEEDLESVEIIRREADRAAKVVFDLRRFARESQDGPSTRKEVDINDVVQHVFKVRRYSLETNNVQVQCELAKDLPPALCDRGEIEQVVLNLVVNAEQAMRDHPGERRLMLTTRANGGTVSILVKDTGPGIPRNQISRIFDPFFTTKAPGEGTGLGLTLVHSIVTELGGTIQVESEPGEGTTFQVRLPEYVPAEQSAAPEQPAPEPVRPPLHVLVVDDEEAVRRISERFLRRLGHRVDVAAEGGEALRLLENEDYDVILCDLRMPGLGGEQLLEHLRQRGDGLEQRLIFVTGDVASIQTSRAMDEDVPVLLKPVRLEALAQAIEGMRG